LSSHEKSIYGNKGILKENGGPGNNQSRTLSIRVRPFEGKDEYLIGTKETVKARDHANCVRQDGSDMRGDEGD